MFTVRYEWYVAGLFLDIKGLKYETWGLSVCWNVAFSSYALKITASCYSEILINVYGTGLCHLLLYNNLTFTSIEVCFNTSKARCFISFLSLNVPHQFPAGNHLLSLRATFHSHLIRDLITLTIINTHFKSKSGRVSYRTFRWVEDL